MVEAKPRLPFLLCASLALAVGLWSSCSSTESSTQMTFLRGNTHTHTLWSDGDAAPEYATDWFKTRGYDFLVLSEHNTIARGDRWFPVKEGTRLTPERLQDLRDQFGSEAVETRENADGGIEMRLQTLDELRARFEEEGGFWLITGEEITDSFERANVHVNALNLAEVIKPQKGDSAEQTIARNVDATKEHGIEHNRPVLAHLNHPNFTWSLSWQDYAQIANLRFFEVYNGHPSVHNSGDASHPSTEASWDLINTARLREHDLPLLLGVATDDSHHYWEMELGKSNPGRGWIQVATAERSTPAVLAAMDAGQFYGSSGVELESFRMGPDSYEVTVAAEEGVQYTIQFIGTRGEEAGTILQESQGPRARYSFQGDELFVRAKVVSDRVHSNPAEEGEMECAWLQPVAVR